MPVDVPQTTVDLDPTILATSLGQNAALGSPYAATAHALGSRWQAVSLTVPGNALPEGLAHLVARNNPALAHAMGRSTGRFVHTPRPDRAAVRTELQRADTAVLTLLVRDGLLSERPQIHITATVNPDGGTSLMAPGLMRESILALDTDPVALFNAAVPLSNQHDPVMLRWFTLFHEAAHAQGALVDHPFVLPGWSAAQNAAMNRLAFDEADVALRPQGIFDESFADIYGAMLLLKITHSSPQAQATLDYVQAVRAKMSADRTADLALRRPSVAAALAHYDPHAVDGAWSAFRADLASGQLTIATLTPDALRLAARQYASRGTVAFLQSPEGQMRNDLGWAAGLPDGADPALPTRSEVFSDIEQTRAESYVRLRFARFAHADHAGLATLPAPAEATDPMIQAMARDDAALYQRFRAVPARERALYHQAVAAAQLNFDPRRTPHLDKLFGEVVATGLHALEPPAVAQMAAAALEADYRLVRPTLAQALQRPASAPITPARPPARRRTPG